MNIVITMAGDGKRFKAAGFSCPKHMIEAKGKTLFEWAVLSLGNFFNENFIFVTRKEHNASEFINRKCGDLGIASVHIKELDRLTAGQADTALEAESWVEDLNSGAMIYNIDTYVEPDQLKQEDIRGDGWLPAFEAEGDRWSFVRFDEDYKVVETTEKIRISDFGTIGFYYFKTFNLFKECYDRHDYEGKEHYIAPLYNHIVENPALSMYTKILDKKKVHVLGTPEDLAGF